MTLHGIGEDGTSLKIHLSQWRLPGMSDPGRLFVDSKLVAIRSEQEAAIIALLKNANVSASQKIPPPQPKKRIILGDDIKPVMEQSESDNIEQFRNEIVAYLKSDEYLDVAENGVSENGG